MPAAIEAAVAERGALPNHRRALGYSVNHKRQHHIRDVPRPMPLESGKFSRYVGEVSFGV